MFEHLTNRIYKCITKLMSFSFWIDYYRNWNETLRISFVIRKCKKNDYEESLRLSPTTIIENFINFYNSYAVVVEILLLLLLSSSSSLSMCCCSLFTLFWNIFQSILIDCRSIFNLYYVLYIPFVNGWDQI